MHIGIVTSGLPFTGDTIKNQALGGSETAAICVSRELAKRGHKVTVFCNCPQPGVYDDVTYLDQNDLKNQVGLLPLDVLIASRWAQFLVPPNPAALKVLWNHDVLTNGPQLASMLWQTDLLMNLSDYHIDDYCGPVGCEDKKKLVNKLPWIRKYIFKTSNGVDLDEVKANIRQKVPGKLIHTSRPERGLLFLLRDILPRLLEKRPGLRLFYCHYDMPEGTELPESVVEQHKMCDALVQKYSKNVVKLGGLPKSGLYQQISSSQLMLYPCNFPEIFNIGSTEAQACGTPFIATNDFALTEVCGPDSTILINGRPTDQKYIDDYVEATLSLLTEDQRPVLNEKGLKLAAAGPVFVESRGYTWAKVAENWDNKFTEILETRFATKKLQVIQELVRNNDVQLATLVVDKLGISEADELINNARKDVICLPAVTSEDKIVEAYKESEKRFRGMLAQLASVGTVKEVLDYECSDICFGIVVKKNYPDTNVTLLARNEEVAERLKSFCEASSVDCVIVSSISELHGKKFDTIILDERIDAVTNPQDVLYAASSHVTEEGVLLFTARYGTKHQTLKGKPDRLWNFDKRDLELLLEGCKYQVSFGDGRDSPLMEVYGSWVGLLKYPTKFGKLDIMAKAKRTKPYVSIAVPMIVKNEAKNILRAIQSVESIADKVVVVDTGSTDDTVEIAKKCGAEVRKIEFDNFRDARNHSLENLGVDWVVWIDADEELMSPEVVRRYICNNAFYEGFALRQNHLQLDVHGTHDLPVRCFRYVPHYKFVGLIHEHIEDTSFGEYDRELIPTLVIDESDIVHYGYTDEKVRRKKCSFRNLELLIRELKDSGGKRMLDWVLVIRDYINILKWRYEKKPVRIVPGTIEYELLVGAVDTFLNKFGDGKSKYYALAYNIYQDALRLMAEMGLPHPATGHPPIQIDFALRGAFGKLDTSSGVLTPKKAWFVCAEEFANFFNGKGVEFCEKMGLDGSSISNTPWKPFVEECPDPEQLLRIGVQFK